MASLAFSTIRRYFSSLCRKASSACLRLVMSMVTPMAVVILPWASKMGYVVKSAGNRSPDFRTKVDSPLKPSFLCRIESITFGNFATSSARCSIPTGLPRTSSRLYPNMRSAPGLNSRIWASVSARSVMTSETCSAASKIARMRDSLSFTASSARLRGVKSRSWATQ